MPPIQCFILEPSGYGVLISLLYQEWVNDLDHNPTPLASRIAVFVLCTLVPTALYLISVAFGWTQFDFATLAADIVTAFTASQLWHGITQLAGKPANPQP